MKMATSSKPKKGLKPRRVVKAASHPPAKISKGKRQAFSLQVYVEVPTLSAMQVCVLRAVTYACHSNQCRGPDTDWLRTLHTKPVARGEYVQLFDSDLQ